MPWDAWPPQLSFKEGPCSSPSELRSFWAVVVCIAPPSLDLNAAREHFAPVSSSLIAILNSWRLRPNPTTFVFLVKCGPAPAARSASGWARTVIPL